MDDVILFVWQRLYRSPYFQEFLHELRQLTRPQLLERIEEMKEWCSDQIDELCDLPEAEINLGYNWNVHMWLLPMENCFSFFHPAEDLINGLSGVKLIGYGPGDSPYRIHRDALGKSSSAIDLNKLEVRFALAYPLFQVIMLATHIPMNVATFIHRQATEVHTSYTYIHLFVAILLFQIVINLFPLSASALRMCSIISTAIRAFPTT